MGKARLFLYSLTKSRWDSSLLPQLPALICHYYLTSGRVLWLFYEHKLTTIFQPHSCFFVFFFYLTLMFPPCVALVK